MSQLCHQISRELNANKDKSKILELVYIYLIVNWNYFVIQRNAVSTNFENVILEIKNTLMIAFKTLLDYAPFEEIMENKMIQDVIEDEELFKSTKKRKIDKKDVEDNFLKNLKEYSKKLKYFEHSEDIESMWIECQEFILNMLNLLCSFWISKGELDKAIHVLIGFDPINTLNVELQQTGNESLKKEVALSEFLLSICLRALEKENYITHCEKAVHLFPNFLLANYVLGN